MQTDIVGIQKLEQVFSRPSHNVIVDIFNPVDQHFDEINHFVFQFYWRASVLNDQKKLSWECINEPETDTRSTTTRQQQE